MSKKATIKSCIGFTELLTIIFITLKLCGVIEWSWWWVFSPVLISIGVFIGIAVAYLILAFAVFIIKGGE